MTKAKMTKTKRKPELRAQCQMCGAVEGLPHHDESCGGVIVALEPHACLLPHHCWMQGNLICQSCKQGAAENELEKSGTPEGMLAKVIRLQDEFWEALGDLEAELDIEIDGTQDLGGTTIEDLREQAAAEHEGDEDDEDDEDEDDEEAPDA